MAISESLTNHCPEEQEEQKKIEANVMQILEKHGHTFGEDQPELQGRYHDAKYWQLFMGPGKDLKVVMYRPATNQAELTDYEYHGLEIESSQTGSRPPLPYLEPPTVILLSNNSYTLSEHQASIILKRFVDAYKANTSSQNEFEQTELPERRAVDRELVTTSR